MSDLTAPFDSGIGEVAATAGCTTTTADIIHRVRAELRRGSQERRNKLSATLTADATTVSFSNEANGYENARLCVDLEDLYVWSTTATTAVVDRAQNGSAAASHAAGAHVLVSPLATNFEILQAANATLDELSSSGLYRVDTLDIPYDAAVAGYNLTDVASIDDILAVRYDEPGTTKLWPEMPRSSWRLARSSATADFASGLQLVLYRPAYHGATVRVVYRAPYMRLSTMADNVQSVSGLHCEAHDLLVLGATMRIVESKPIERARTDGQGDTRRPSEVGVSSVLQAPERVERRWRSRLRKEKNRLYRAYPMRTR